MWEKKLTRKKDMQLKNKHSRKNKEYLIFEIENSEEIIIEEIANYMYLGMLINKYEEQAEIYLRLTRSNKCVGSLYEIIKFKHLF